MNRPEDKSSTRPVLSVIIPIYNEEAGIQELYDRLCKSVSEISEKYQFVFVNDGSKDGSLTELKRLADADPRVFFIDFSRNFGHQLAVTAGIDHSNGQAVVIIDGDLQDPPELIPEMYRKYKEGYDVVYARRSSRKGESLFKKWSAKLFYRVLQKLTSIEIPVDTGDFRLIDAKVIKYLRQMPERNKFIRGQVAWLGFRQTFVTFERDERKHGETGYSFGKMLGFALDGITGFSTKPLAFVSRIGILVSGISLLIILYAIISHFVLDRTITGWTSMIISTMFIGGVQLISIGIIGEYISRINTNVLQRPPYIISDSNLDQDITPG